MTFLLLSFIAGVLTVLAPCVLPLLPVIIGGSISDGSNKRKSYVIIGSLIISIVLFTLILKWSTAFITIPPQVWQYISGGILILVALTMIFPGLWERLPFVERMGISSNKVLGAGYKKKNFWGDVIIGASLGPVFSSCSPTYFVILATVLPQSFGKGLVYLVAYALGLGLILLVISLLGQRITEKLGTVTDPKGWLKKGVGILFLLIGIFVLSGLDKKIQTSVISSGVFDITKVEQKLLQSSEAVPAGEQVQNTSILTAEQKALQFAKYKEITRPDGYVNTNSMPITIGQYVGKKVILLDILTYSCINCQRTFPYLNDWYTKYEDKGLIIIGIHTPEFAFEHLQKNVEAAAKQFGLKFPLVLDNNYGTWNAYGNNYWPRKYLIDIDGYVVYDHIGEGNYDVTESKIVELLNERAKLLGEPSVMLGANQMPETELGGFNQSPETYLGSERSEYAYSGNGNLPKNRYSLTGDWDEKPEYAELSSDAGSIRYHFSASKVHLVASSAIPANAQIFLDGKLITVDQAGGDVKNGLVQFNEARLYTLVDLKDGPSEHVLEIKVMQKGLEAYAFTFS